MTRRTRSAFLIPFAASVAWIAYHESIGARAEATVEESEDIVVNIDDLVDEEISTATSDALASTSPINETALDDFVKSTLTNDSLFSEEDDEPEFDYMVCAQHDDQVDYFDYSEIDLVEEGNATHEEAFFSFLNHINMDIDDWDITLQQGHDMKYFLVFEQDEIRRTFALPDMFNNLTEDEIVDLVVGYFSEAELDEQPEEPSTPKTQKQAKIRRRKEHKILSLFFESIKGSSALKNDGRWLSNETVCNWYGIVCGYRGQHKAGMKGANPTPPPEDAVTAIQLNNLEMSGTLPTELAQLEHLSQLILRNNKIHGTIPANLAYATKLCVLDLSHNELTGSIPAILSAKTKSMYQVHLNKNYLSGNLPRNMRAWRKLWLLDVSQNNITGTIPRRIENLEDLAILSLGDNMFTGTIPTSFFRLSNLQLLDLGTNMFEGDVNLNFLRFDNMLDINLADNMFEGTFPSHLLFLPNLHSLLLSHNHLTGELPRIWHGKNESRVSLLHFSHNELEGTIPETLFTELYKTLALLDVSYNKLTGSIAPEIGLMTSLHTIDAMGNRISGSLPSEMLRLNPNLRLNFTDNLITGTIPPMFCGEGMPTNNILYRDFGCDAVLCRKGTFNPSGHATLHSACRVCDSIPQEEKDVLGRVKCDGLDYVHGDLDGDGVVSQREVLRMIYIDNIGKFWGPEFQTWAEMKYDSCELHGVSCNTNGGVSKIDLSNAHLCSSGDRQPGPVKFCLGIPTEIGLLTDMEVFQASRRQYLRGTLPTEFGKLTKLKVLDISSCPLMHGTIPTEFGRLSSLRHLLLAHGPFKGTLPSGIFHLTDLEKLHLTKNSLTGTLPQMIRTTNLKELMISRNALHGSLPTQLGRLTLLENFEGYSNDFTGTLPTEIGKCQSLRRMDIFNNNLNGTLPTEIGNMKKLSIFHVKSNNMDGTIPACIGELPQISWFDISENRLVGTIPESFANAVHLKDFRLSNNYIHEPIPQGLCTNRNLNSGATRWGCSGVACPLGTIGDLGFATDKHKGCKPCPEGQSTMYLAGTQCRLFSYQDVLGMMFDVMDGENWPEEYQSTWHNRSVEVCDWHGVRCDENGDVIGIALPSTGNEKMYM